MAGKKLLPVTVLDISACYPYVTCMYRVDQSDPRVNSYVTSMFYACTRLY